MTRTSIGRAILFIVTALVVAVYYLPLGHTDYLNNWRTGTYGFSVAPLTNTVDSVEDANLLRDGVRPGDHMLVTPFTRRYSRAQFPRLGEQMTLVFQTRHGLITEHLVARADPSFDLWQRLGGALAIIPATVFLIVAFMLVYARPGVMTWMFYLFAVGYFSTKPSIAYFNFLPESLYRGLTFFIFTLFGNFAVLPLVPFVLRFPNNDMSGWRRGVDPFVWAVMVGSFALYVWQWWIAVGGGPMLMPELLQSYVPLAAFAIAASLMLKNFTTAPPEVRQRMSWLVAGTFISFIAYAIYFVPDIQSIGFVSPFSDNIRQVVGFAVILMPISVAYAVLRHRVIDINFVINRAIVYGILSVLLVVFVSLLDWASSRILGEAHLTTLLEAGVTIALGFALNRLHKTFEEWVDRVLFWRRHRAERYLQRVAAALPFATSEDAITDGLVHEPCEALDLAGAALYRRANDEVYELRSSHRASPVFARMDPNHNLVRFLKSEEKAVWLEDLGLHREDGMETFVIAVPILVRHELLSFTLYAAHRNGAQIDPDELSIFEHLGREAARAYDHVEAVRTREQLASVQQKLERFESQPRLGQAL